MPNWCCGSLKLRGPYENRVKFLTEGLNSYEGHWDFEKDQYIDTARPKEKWIHRIEEYGEVGAREFVMEIEPGEWIYVEDTKRAFITSDYIDVAEIENATTVEISQAWDFRVNEWADISKKYGLDIKLWGVDHGWGFMHEAEIIQGEVVSDISKHWAMLSLFAMSSRRKTVSHSESSIFNLPAKVKGIPKENHHKLIFRKRNAFRYKPHDLDDEYTRNCPNVEWEHDMGKSIPFCKLDGEMCNLQCRRKSQKLQLP